MKKSLFFLATAALVLASCENDQLLDKNTGLTDANQPQEIAFTPFSTTPKRSVKRAAVDGTAFDTGTSMKVSAWDVVTGSGRNFFSDKTFAKGAGATWVTTPATYWPLSPTTINFLAYANLTEGSAAWDTDAAKEVVLTMGNNKTEQNDLMYAIGTGTVVKNPDNSLTFPTSVPMVFKHAQAWIQFSVKATDATVAAALTINKITLNDVSCQGTCTVTQTNYNATSGQSVAASWTAYDTYEDDVDAVVADGYLALSNVKQEYANLMVVPDNGMASFTVNYTLDSKQYEYTYTLSSSTLAQGKKYTYDINFNLHQIEIAPSITDWDDVTPVNVEVPNEHVFAYSVGAVAGTYNVAATAGTYSCTITGLTAGATYDLTKEGSAAWLTLPVSSVVADPNGKVNITFTVEANAGALQTENIVLTNHEDGSENTKVTVSQAEGN